MLKFLQFALKCVELLANFSNSRVPLTTPAVRVDPQKRHSMFLGCKPKPIHFSQDRVVIDGRQMGELMSSQIQ